MASLGHRRISQFPPQSGYELLCPNRPIWEADLGSDQDQKDCYRQHAQYEHGHEANVPHR